MMNPEERKFEDAIVHYLLHQYELHDTRAKFMLLDIEEHYFDSPRLPCVAEGHSPPRLLSLRAFHRFFSRFPVALATSWLSQQDAQRTTLVKGLADMQRTLFARDYDQLCDSQSGAEETRPIGRIYHQPYQRSVATSLVMHNIPTVDTRVPGLHLCLRLDSGDSMMVQTLDGFVATVKLRFPEALWMDSALDENFRDVVSKSNANQAVHSN